MWIIVSTKQVISEWTTGMAFIEVYHNLRLKDLMNQVVTVNEADSVVLLWFAISFKIKTE